jgi:hypothetical protein
MNSMDEPMDTTEQPLDGVDKALRTGLDRRTMLKAALATGTIAATWVAPHIETFGFAPAGAATVCPLTSNDNTHSNCGQNTYVSPPTLPPGCMQSFGSQGNQFQTITINHPTSTCNSFTVRFIPADCTMPGPTNPDPHYNPDISGFAVVFDSSDPAPPSTACDCKITKALIYKPSNHDINNPDQTFTMPSPCADAHGGIQVNLDCDLTCNSRIAVVIECTTTGHC